MKPKIDVPLLKSVLSIQTSSHDDDEMRTYIRSFAKKYKLPIVTDAFGNLYITKGKTKMGYPCMISHIDTVHEILKDFAVFEHKGSIFAYTADGCHQVGVGGDDKVGVYACLQALLDFPVIKVVFFRQEEIGCLGSANANMQFFNDCNFVLQLDRRGHSDFSINAGGVELSSPEFREKMKPLLSKWRFKEARTITTDVMKLKQRGLDICAANISCGYYYPHTYYEVVLTNDVNRAYCLAHEIITKFGSNSFEHIYRPPKPRALPRSRTLPLYGPSSKLPLNQPIADNEEDRGVVYQMFQKYPGSIYPFMYIDKGKPIAYKSKYLYIPGKKLLYNRYINEWVTDIDEMKEIYRDFMIKDNGKEFVFSWRFWDWMDKSQARWLSIAKTWLLSKHLSRWEELKQRGDRRRKAYLSADVLTEKLEMPHQTNTTE